MKKMQIAALLIATIAGASIAHAATSFPMASGPFNLPGGLVKPQEELSISLESLPDGGHGVYYDITCYVENTNFSKLYPVVLQVLVGSNQIYVNGRKGFQSKLDKLTNVVELRRMMVFHHNSQPPIKFNNLDSTDSVYVQYCSAVYSSS